MNKIILVAILIILTACEEVIEIDLNTTDPQFVIEAVIFKDSVSSVRLTRTTSYFNPEVQEIIEDAVITVSNEVSSEQLQYEGKGYYKGSSIIGAEENTYGIEISHNGIVYEGTAYMPLKTDIISSRYFKSQEQSTLNPFGETVFTIECEFMDNPDEDNYYMIKYVEDGEMIEKNYFMLTEYDAIGGTFENNNDTICFSESIFYEGGEVEVQVFSIDRSAYNYFMQLNEILFWKRRIMPPTPYNPQSNLNNGALGYFAAWAYDSEILLLE